MGGLQIKQHFTHKSVQKCNFGFYSITGNYTNEIRLKVCQKSNISEKKMVANFGFNCKNGKVSPIFIFFISNIYIPKMKNKKKRSLILMRTQIGFNLKCIAQCICSKSSRLTFLDNVWFGMFERSLRPVLRVADSP